MHAYVLHCCYEQPSDYMYWIHNHYKLTTIDIVQAVAAMAVMILHSYIVYCVDNARSNLVQEN